MKKKYVLAKILCIIGIVCFYTSIAWAVTMELGVEVVGESIIITLTWDYGDDCAGHGGVAIDGGYRFFGPNPYVRSGTIVYYYPYPFSPGRHICYGYVVSGMEPWPGVETYVFFAILSPAEQEGLGFGKVTDSNAATDDPINIATGNMYHIVKDLVIAGQGLPLDFQRTYNSRDSYNGPLGYGWTHSYNIELIENPDNYVVQTDEDGTRHIFINKDDGTYSSMPGEHSTLTKNGDGTYLIKTKQGVKYNFDTTGRLLDITDRNSNTVTLTYTGSLLTTITDSTNRNLTLTYDANDRIIQLTDPASNSITYDYDANGNLIQVTDRAGHSTVYTYDADHNITKITDPENRSAYFSYNAQDRAVSNWNDNDYNKVTLSYDQANKITSVAEDNNKFPVTAILVSDVSHGTLIFNSDGTFNYTPDSGYVGPDSFTYKLNDGVEDSEVTTVTLNVTAN